MKITFFHVKLAHSVIFWILSACTLYALYSGLFDRVTVWTWAAVGALLIESLVLWLSGWTCPLTLFAERLGAKRGAVTDLFLPRWFADRIFPICGTLYAVALAAILWRVLG